jgi:hypothetical protein
MPTPKLTTEIITAAIDGYEVQKTRIDARIAELRALLAGGPAKVAATSEAAKAQQEKAARKKAAAKKPKAAKKTPPVKKTAVKKSAVTKAAPAPAQGTAQTAIE